MSGIDSPTVLNNILKMCIESPTLNDTVLTLHEGTSMLYNVLKYS